MALRPVKQVRDPVDVNLLPGPADNDTPSRPLLLIEMVDLERQCRLLHREPLRAAFHAEDDVGAGEDEIDGQRDWPEIVLVYQSSDTCLAQ
jgi:hypothetical protein